MPNYIPNRYLNDEDDSVSETDTNITIESENPDFSGKNDLILCEIFNPCMHGFTTESDRNVLGHFLVIGRYSMESMIQEDSSIFSMKYVINSIHSNIRNLLIENPRFAKHPWIRNYKEIVLRDDYIRPEIAECIMLKGDEKVAILKTFWIRIVQRAWKKLFQARCLVRNKRMELYSLAWRQIYGKWPDSCVSMPTIHGILCK